MILIVTKKKLMRGFFLILVMLVGFGAAKGIIGQKTMPVSTTEDFKTCYVAIVIDDFGYDGEGTEEMLALDIPLTAAIMPFSPNSSVDCDAVIAAGKEVIIHMPMESQTGKKSWVGDKAVFSTMTDSEISDVVKEALEIVKNAKGINNHMGSKIMEDERSLNVVMSVAAERGLIFIDSKTTPKSVAKQSSEKFNVPILERDVFLDSTDDINVIRKKLNQTAQIAQKKGYALAIGHVGPEGGKITAQAIKELAPQMEQQGIQFVTVSQFNEIVVAKKNQEVKSGYISE